MYEYDELAESSIIYRDHRLSNYLTFSFQPLPNLTLANTTYYQPQLPDFRLPRISTVTTLTLGISSRLRFTSNFSLTQDARVSRDLPDIPETSYTWINGLRWTFCDRASFYLRRFAFRIGNAQTHTLGKEMPLYPANLIKEVFSAAWEAGLAARTFPPFTAT
jgi:hypothetical protein